MSWALKLLGALCIVAGCSAGGWILSHRLGTRTASLRLIRTFFLRLQTQLQYTAMPFEQAAAEQYSASREQVWIGEIVYQLRRGAAFGTAFDTAMQKYASSMALQPQDTALLHRCGKRLGSTDVPGQLTMLSLIAAELREQTERAAEDEDRRSRLFRSLGLLGGVLVVVVLL